MGNIQNAWHAHTQTIYRAVLIIAIAGIIGALYDYVALPIGLMDYVGKYLSLFRKTARTLASFVGMLNVIGALSKLAIVGGYFLYLSGLKRFMSIQSSATTAKDLERVRRAIVILLCCYLATTLFSIILNIPILGTIISLAVWISTLIAYIKMKKAFGNMKQTAPYNANAIKGVAKLQKAAKCSIWLMLMTLITLVALAIVILIAIEIKSIDAAIVLGAIVFIATLVCTLVFMVIAFFYPIFGWKLIMNGAERDKDEKAP